MAESVQNLKKEIKLNDSINTIDTAFEFAIMKMIKHTAFSACRDGSFFA